jgi:hypothetical protein
VRSSISQMGQTKRCQHTEKYAFFAKSLKPRAPYWIAIVTFVGSVPGPPGIRNWIDTAFRAGACRPIRYGPAPNPIPNQTGGGWCIASHSLSRGLSLSLDYCLLPSPLLRVSSAAVDGLTFMMKYPLPSSTITDTCVLLSGAPQLSVTVQSGATE